MWMMGCSDCCYNSSSKFNFNRSESDSIKGRKLRPLIPRPTTPIPTYSAMANPSSYCSCLHKANIVSLNDHLATIKDKDQSMAADINNTVPLVVTARWNPTPEQLRALEEMYEGGIRTPTADQIQQIAARLRRFGKIEGKNVFYWFQNHKARERQKRRRILESFSQEQLCDIRNLERKEPATGMSKKTGFEVAHTKNRATSSNCSTLSEESVSIHRAVGSESRIDGQWIQFEERELQQQRRRRSTQTKHATWQLMKPSSTPLIHFMNTTMTTTTTAPEALATTNLCMALSPNNTSNIVTNFEVESKQQPQTLQLFPIQRDNVKKNVAEVPMREGTIDTSFSPNQYFEFLPLKN